MTWTIRKKLLGGFLAVIAIVLALGTFALMRMSSLNADTVEIGTHRLTATCLKHESQHRGQIALSLKRSGLPLCKKVLFGIWDVR
ncbi:MAG: hypothetical protein M3362_18580 [Acidobacteriota bacterium]|nr:hypothetical protein [Acidobacteriota bacterium]